jgi:hypothetical protein
MKRLREMVGDKISLLNHLLRLTIHLLREPSLQV